MATRELAAKLERRYAALSLNDDDNGDAGDTTAYETSTSLPPITLTPEPVAEHSPGYFEPEEVVDIDMLICETLKQRKEAELLTKKAETSQAVDSNNNKSGGDNGKTSTTTTNTADNCQAICGKIGKKCEDISDEISRPSHAISCSISQSEKSCHNPIPSATANEYSHQPIPSTNFVASSKQLSSSISNTLRQKPVLPAVSTMSSDIQPTNPASSEVCSKAPVVRITHNKSAKATTKKVTLNEYDSLKKERDELEERLAKQRRRKFVPLSLGDMSAALTDELAQKLAKQRQKQSESVSTTEELQVSSCNSTNLYLYSDSKNDCSLLDAAKTATDLSAISPSADSGISVRSPPPVARKPSLILNAEKCYSANSTMEAAVSTNSNNHLINSDSRSAVSPTCSSSSHVSEECDELAAKLARRNMMAEGEPVEPAKPPKLSIYSEFHEFSRKQVKYFMETFKRFDDDCDNFIDFNELKRMMEKLGEPQTHIALKTILKLVDEDKDGKVNLREFLLIFRYAATGQLSCSEVFNELASSVDVSKEGVKGAANFFQARIEEQARLSRFEEEIKAEREERLREEEERQQRRRQFLANKAAFQG